MFKFIFVISLLSLLKQCLPLPKYALFQIWLKLSLWVYRKRFLKILLVFSEYYATISTRKRKWPFIWTSLKVGLYKVCLKLATWFWRIRSTFDILWINGQSSLGFLLQVTQRLVVEINHHDIYHTNSKIKIGSYMSWLRVVLTTVLPG